MLWLKFGWRNLWRNPGRTMIQLAVIAGSMFFAVLLNNVTVGSYDKMIEDAVKTGSGHITLHHPDFLDEQQVELSFNGNLAMTHTAHVDTIRLALPRVRVSGLARSSRESSAVLISGVDFASEQQVSPIFSHHRLVEGEIPAPGDQTQAYIGIGLARKLQLRIGQRIVFMFQAFDGEISSALYRVGGIFSSKITQIDNNMVFVERKSIANSLGDEEAVHELALLLTDRHQQQSSEKRLQQIFAQENDIAVYGWETTSRQMADLIKYDHAQLKVMVAFLFILVAIGTVNLLLIGVMERIREFGLLRAVGLEKRKIRWVICCEALLLGFVGNLIGIFFSTAVGLYTWTYGLDFSFLMEEQEIAGAVIDPIIHSAWDWKATLLLFCIMMILVLLASLYPAAKALRTAPAAAMHKY